MNLLRFLGAPVAIGLLAALALAPQACVVVEENCLAEAACGPNEVEVDACNDNGSSCREVEACGSVVFCEESAQCDAYPSCEPDMVEVQTCPTGVTCETKTLCGSTILCAPATGECMSNADCTAEEFCDFRDGQCGAGGVGECQPLPNVCTDGPPVCFCDGTVTQNGDLGCEGWGGKDLDSTGSCTIPATAIACGHRVCDFGTDDYCRLTSDDTGGAPYADCSFAPSGCDPAACACLTAETQACGGTCEDGPNGPTIHCPGG